MADFNPSPHQKITIGGLAYQVMPHPAVPTFAFGQEGRKAFVYQIAGGADKRTYALKVFKLAYRVPELVEVCDHLARFAQWPGLEVCYRECLNADRHGDILAKHPDLEYAVLMPWISGSTWYDMVIGMTPLSRLESATYANAIAQVLAAIEEAGLAHCDISAANVIINPTTERAHLIDVEDLYAPSFSPPAALPAGTDGYAHHRSSEGQWGPEADRFAGAVLIAEMLAWHDARIRREAEDEHYFAVTEMQVDSPRYRLMIEVLDRLDPRLVDLFNTAWQSETLAACPPLKNWQEVISEVYHRERVAGVVSDWKPLIIPGSAVSALAEPPRQPLTPAPAPEPEPEEEPTPAAAAANEPAIAQAPPPAPVVQQQRPAPAAPIIQPVMPPPATQPPATSGPLQPKPRRPAGSPVVEWRPIAAPPPPVSRSAVPGTVWEPIAAPLPQPEPLPVEGEAAPDEEPPIEPGGEPDSFEAAYEEPEFYEEPVAPAGAPAPAYPEDEAPEEEPAIDAGLYDGMVDELIQVHELGLLKPVLDLQMIDERSRPHLVWSESPGADSYLLQEDNNVRFDAAKEYRIKGGETHWQPPRLLWRRTGRLYYRVRAEAGDAAGPWSETVAVRVGKI